MNCDDPYDFKEHLHRYAVWTAARAQRAFATTAFIKEAIEKVNLKEEAFKLTHDCNTHEFDGWHSEMCNQLVTVLNRLQEERKTIEVYKYKTESEIEFGRAAKIVNIYLKTALVIPNCKSSTPLINNIHPPIDAILLKGLVENETLEKSCCVPWTKMKKEKYIEIINQIRSRYSILWMAEHCWKPEQEKDKNISKGATTNI